MITTSHLLRLGAALVALYGGCKLFNASALPVFRLFTFLAGWRLLRPLPFCPMRVTLLSPVPTGQVRQK